MLNKKSLFNVLITLFIPLIFTHSVEAEEFRFDELTNLADQYGTDKGSEIHYYTEVYSNFFEPVRKDVKRVLEIGVWNGASMKMFSDYFPNARIYGLDIEDTSQYDTDRVTTFIADQSDREALEKFIESHGGEFDIIIDDGGHSMEQQQVSFGYLFKYLKPGGLYIIEDLHTSLLHLRGKEHGAEEGEKNTTLMMVYKFMRGGVIRSDYMPDAEEIYLTGNIEYCNLFSRSRGRSIMGIFKKKSTAQLKARIARNS